MQIFESSSFISELGAGIGIGPNAHRVMSQLLPELKWENLRPVENRLVRLSTQKRVYGRLDVWTGMYCSEYETHEHDQRNHTFVVTRQRYPLF